MSAVDDITIDLQVKKRIINMPKGYGNKIEVRDLPETNPLKCSVEIILRTDGSSDKVEFC